jgi:hypothetical protein
MTLLQIVREHCANWRSDGKGCLGAILDDDLQVRHCWRRPTCALSVVGERCRYFEECVLPMGRSIENPVYQQAFEEAVRLYRVRAKLAYADERPCPVCGRAMEPRRRFCHACARARHRANQRGWVAARRAAMKAAAVRMVAGAPAVGAVVG